jgi:hypothetical protein
MVHPDNIAGKLDFSITKKRAASSGKNRDLSLYRSQSNFLLGLPKLTFVVDKALSFAACARTNFSTTRFPHTSKRHLHCVMLTL